jgi:hypothetical protein
MIQRKRKSLAPLLPCFLLLAASSWAQSAAQTSFAEIKTLAGTWEGKAAQGMPVKVSFRETAGGSAVMSEILGHGAEDMITMFYLDGPDKLLLTHYCSAGNQPRMQAAASPDGKTLTFNFLDSTNLPSLEDGHMRRVVIAMLGPDHHTEEWTFTDHGKEVKEFFDLYRK